MHCKGKHSFDICNFFFEICIKFADFPDKDNIMTELTKDTVVCVTGVCGHLGSVVAAQLCAAGCKVRGLRHRCGTPELLQGLDIDFFDGDVNDPASLDAFMGRDAGAPLCVVHCAGLISIVSSYQKELHRVNVEGTKNVVEAAVRNGAEKLVYVSSVHAIAVEPGVKVITETDLFDPSKVVGDYAKTKCEATGYVLSRACDLDLTVVHPSGIFGPYDTGRNSLVALVKSVVVGGRRTGVAGGYDMADVRDVAAGTVSALTRGGRGECYLLSGNYISVKDLMDMSLKDAGIGRKMFYMPLWAASAAAPFAELYARIMHKKPLFTSYAIHTVGSVGNFSHAKATEVLGYNPRPLAETVSDTVSYLLEIGRAHV